MIKRKRLLFKTLTVILATSMLGVTATSAFTSQSRSVLAASADFTVKANTDQNAKPNVAGEFADPSKYQGDIPVQVLGINDLHGNIDTVTKQTRIGNPVKSYSNTGTAARLAAYLDNAEAQFFKENPSANKENSFRVESGDMVGASPSVSALLQDEPTMHVLKTMGIEIGTLGNHEFDEGLGEFYRILEGNAPEKGKFNKITEDRIPTWKWWFQMFSTRMVKFHTTGNHIRLRPLKPVERPQRLVLLELIPVLYLG